MDGRGVGPEPVATVRSLEGRAEENKKPAGGAGGEGDAENNPEIPPSSRDEGLRLLHGLETNLAASLQTPQEA